MKCQFSFLSHIDAILVFWRYIQINFFSAYFYEQMLLEIFVANGDTAQQFLKKNSLNSYIFINNLILKYFSEEWEQIYQFSLQKKTIEGNSAAIYFP